MNAGELPAGSRRDSQTERLVQAFLALTLPKPEWTHHAHLRVGLWHVLRHPPAEALALLRERISRYNAAVGVVNTPTSGYHETITAFYTWQITWFAETSDLTNDARQPLDALGDELIARFGAKDLPFEYWTKDRLDSTEARLSWLPPDLRPLAPTPKSGWTLG